MSSLEDDLVVYTKFLKDNAGEKDAVKAVLEDVMDKRGYKEAHKRHKKFNLIRFLLARIQSLASKTAPAGLWEISP